MTAIELLALSKLTISKDDRKSITPGKHSGTFLAEVTFDLKVGQDFSQRVAASVPWQRLAAVALSKLNGVTIESIVREALADDIDDTEVAERAKAAVAAILGTTERKVAGKVTGSVTVAPAAATQATEAA